MADASTVTRPVRARRSAPEAAPSAVAVSPPPALEPAPAATPPTPALNGNGNGAEHAGGFGPRPPVRRPFGVRRQKLFYPPDPAFHRHWFHDEPGRIAWAIECGWKHVTGDDGKNVSRATGTKEGGGGLISYLMELPIEWYKEDQAAKLKSRDEIDGEIRRGIVAGRGNAPIAPGQDERYVDHRTSAGLVGAKMTAQVAPDGRQFFGNQAAAPKE